MVKKIYLLISILLSVFYLNSVNAAVCYDCIKSGDSLKGIAKIGSRYVGADGYYQFDDNTWDTSTASGNFDVSWYKHSDTLSGSELVGFSVDFCVNGKQPDFQIWSYYDNYVDFYYPLGTKEYLGNEEWTGSDCYRAYIRLKMSYYDNLSTSSDGIDFINYSFNSNIFAIRTHFGYGAILKFTDLVYLNTKDYNELLTEAKSSASSQIIINQNIVTNEKLDNIDDTLNDSNIDNPNFEEFEEYIAENGVITQLITLPVRLYTQILNSINSPCTPFVLGELFGHNLTMSCINPINFFGSVLWNTVDILASGLFVYAISKKMIAVFQKFTNLEEGDILD